MLIDTFVNAIFLYDDKMLLTFNFKDGTKTITFSDVNNALERADSGSDLDCSGAPNKNDYFDRIIVLFFYAEKALKAKVCFVLFPKNEFSVEFGE